MDVISILNTIRSNASNTYQERVPEATRENVEAIRAVMIGDDPIVANEFVSTLLNKLVKSVVHTKIFTNPLKSLKQGKKPLGDTIEEIYNNFIKGQPFDGSGNTTALLGRTLPDTNTVYHRMNYKMKYPVTVTREMLSKAFTSYDALDSYISNLINTIYNSAELDEFINTKQLIKSALDNNALKVVHIEDPTNEANGKAFIKAVKTVSGLMTFPSDEWNSYTAAQSVDTVPITTFSRKNEQVLILDTATDTSVSVDVLASLFNMTVAEFNDTRKIVIDVFPDPDIRAALVDQNFFQIYDDLITVGSFNNGESLYTNYWLHVWQTLAYSILVNGVVFKVGSDADSDGSIEDYTVTYNLASGVTSSNKRTKTGEGGSFTTTLSGASGKTVNVTMGGSPVSGAYDAETGKVKIDNVTGNILITVA